MIVRVSVVLKRTVGELDKLTDNLSPSINLTLENYHNVSDRIEIENSSFSVAAISTR